MDIAYHSRVRLTNPNYPEIDETGELTGSSLTVAREGVYGTHSIKRDDGTRFRSEGVLTHAPR